MYWKLSIRNARRSFKNYLLYIVTMTVLLAVMEVSNCIAVKAGFSDFQTASLPLLIIVIQIILVGYIDTFLFKQRAKEFANYLLLGMQKKNLTRLFLLEILLIGIYCFVTGTTAGFALYALFGSCEPLCQTHSLGLLYYKSVSDTFYCFCIIEIVCGVRLKWRLHRLQIRELMQEKSHIQQLNPNKTSTLWGIIFLGSLGCLTGCVCGIAFLSDALLSRIISVVVIPLMISIIAFYQWIFRQFTAYRRKRSVSFYQKNRLYLTAAATYNAKTAAVVNAVFCMCLIFSACSYITGRFMLAQDSLFMEETTQYWLGTAQLGICVVFTVLYFSILALQQIIEFQQNAKHYQLLCWIGHSSKQIRTLVIQQIAIRLTLPMVMACLILILCFPLLNLRMNTVLPPSMHNALLNFLAEYLARMILFYFGYFFVVYTMSKASVK